jgi:hypothetical protein
VSGPHWLASPCKCQCRAARTTCRLHGGPSRDTGARGGAGRASRSRGWTRVHRYTGALGLAEGLRPARRRAARASPSIVAVSINLHRARIARDPAQYVGESVSLAHTLAASRHLERRIPSSMGETFPPTAPRDRLAADSQVPNATRWTRIVPGRIMVGDELCNVNRHGLASSELPPSMKHFTLNPMTTILGGLRSSAGGRT